MPLFDWATAQSNEWAGERFPHDEDRYNQLRFALYRTFRGGWMLAVAAMVGYIAAHIYNVNSEKPNRDECQ